MVHWTAADLPRLTGATVVVTGASSGIGLIAARELARVGARVVLAVRDLAKGAAAASAMRGRVEVRELDLASLASIRRFAGRWTGNLDVLINNAGIMMVPRARTADGFELQMATNYLGPFALTNLLLPYVTDRVVTVSSVLHRLGRPRPDDLAGERRRYNALAAYCDSKLADLLFARELHRRLVAAGSPVRSIAAHPGVATSTNLVAHTEGLVAALISASRFLQHDAEHAARPILYAATQDVPGAAYVGPGGFAGFRGYPEVGRPSRAARNERAAARLWAASARLTGVGG